MRLMGYIWECQHELDKIVNRMSYQLINSEIPVSKIIVDTACDIQVVRTNILDLLNRLDNDILIKEVGKPDGEIHQRDD